MANSWRNAFQPAGYRLSAKEKKHFCIFKASVATMEPILLTLYYRHLLLGGKSAEAIVIVYSGGQATRVFEIH